MSDQKPSTNEERLERANQLIGRISGWVDDRVEADDATRVVQIQRLIAEFETREAEGR